MLRLLLVTILILIHSVVLGQPLYISCDPDPNAVEYMVEFDGNTMGPMTPYSSDATDTRVMDIEPLMVIDQPHTIRLAGVNSWGDVGEWSDPFDFRLSGTDGVIVRVPPNPPAILRLLSN